MSRQAGWRAAANALPQNVQGMGWMILAGIIFVSFNAVIRHVSSDMHPMQAAFLRYIFGLIFLAPYFIGRRLAALRTRRLGLFAFRGLIHGLGVLLWFYAMSRLPLAQITALSFLTPVFATIGAILFLGEKVSYRRIGAVMFGFAGAMVILRPGVVGIDIGAVAMLVAAPLFAGSKLITKALTRTETTAAIVAYLAIFVTLVQLAPALWVWRQPTGQETLLLAGTAVLATGGHLCQVQALKLAELTAVQPVEFLTLVWATLFGFFVFAEVPLVWTWIGGVMIIGSATYIARREALARRRTR